MIAIAAFLKDLCILLYRIVKPLILALVPRSILYKELKNEVVLVTGGGNGIGRQLAMKLSHLGCSVIVWDIDAVGGKETVRRIRDAGGKGYFYRCNVADRRDVYSNALKTREEAGPVTLLINNAAVVTPKSLLECPDHLIEKTFAVNILGYFWMCKAFLPDMAISNRGHIVNIASLAGHFGLCDLSSYCSSKAAVVNFHESLSIELQRSKLYGIKTTLVSTWHIDTNMFRGAKVRFFTSLRASDVADRVISAIRSNEEVAIIPWYFRPAIWIKSMVPLSACYKVLEIGGAFNCLDDLAGATNGDTK